MFTYLLKRLLYLLPTVWVIVTSMFLLSRFIPGSYLDLKISSLTEQAQPIISKVQEKSLISETQKKYGQDKPVFYFSIRSAAEPDTLDRIEPEKEKEVLQQWVLEKGNWPLIQEYYLQAKNLQKQLPATDQYQALQLTRQPDLKKSGELLQQFKTGYSADQKIYSLIIQTEIALTNLQHAPFSIKIFIPLIDWQGTENQYHNWFIAAVRGNLGVSYRDESPVMGTIAEAFWNTFFIMLASFVLIAFAAIELSLFLAHSGQKQLKNTLLNVLRILDSIPVFLLTLSILILFSGFGAVPLFPVLGVLNQGTSWWATMLALFYYLSLPVLCLTLARLPYFVTQLYYSLQQVLSQDYIKTAKAKGIPENKILRKHALRNAILPLITALSDFLPGLLAGSLVIEIIFAIPGVGRLLADSVLARDYPVVLGIVLFVAIFKILANVAADLLYYVADPKIKLS